MALRLVWVTVLMPATAMAFPCGVSGIEPRFHAAAELCGSLPPTVEKDAVASRTSTPDDVSPVPAVADIPASVSITMVPSRAQLARATRAVRALGQAPTEALIAAVGRRYRIDPRLLAAIVRAESGGRMDAVSNKGALGLMQVMPATAASLGVANPRALLTNRALAIDTGARYLKTLQARFGNRPALVVAAYNAGPGAVEKAGRRVPAYRVTRSYVSRVMGDYVGAVRPGAAR